ncbi:hypothetical protein NQ315_011304 [Exocentrus adspersus]|uniref:Nuclease HARBI1 n=1 Tax=Exocentrus adspersus TaxID=1586481 RepID=A0AAV8VK55_9CUCU|nr:hypothetical protein NQ315_011304 [Exocentrus adspersus]
MDSDDDIYNDELEMLDIIEHGFPRQRNVRKNYFEDLDNLNFLGGFAYKKKRNDSISPINQLLSGLRFYATAGHLSSIADFEGMAISSASRIIKRVSEAIARLHPRYMKMSSADESVRQQNKFHRVAAFPRVAGLIDCTHIRIQSPVLAYGMRLKLETVLTVISATAVLHNLAREMNEPEPPPADEINMEELEYLINTEQIPVAPAVQKQRKLLVIPSILEIT